MTNIIQTVQHIYDCFLKGDMPGIMQHLDENVQWEAWADNQAQKAGVPWLQHRTGKAGAGEFFQFVGQNMNITTFNVLNIMEGKDCAAVELEIGGSIPATGREFMDEEMHLWSFNESGKVTRLRHYTDTHKHMAAAGVLAENTEVA